MGTVEKGEVQLPVTIALRPENPAAYAVSVLRVLARKDVGEPITPQEREATRMALRLLGKEW